MVKAAIIAHPEEVRAGLSRPALKKWIHATYPHTAQASDASFSTNLSRAIATGEEKNVLLLPKGPSGKVKLAPSAKPKAKSTKSAAKKSDKGEGKDADSAKPAPAKKVATTAAPKKKTEKKDSKKEEAKKAGPKKTKEGASKPVAKKAAAPKKASSTTKKVSQSIPFEMPSSQDIALAPLFV